MGNFSAGNSFYEPSFRQPRNRFLIMNIGFFIFGILCWLLFPVLKDYLVLRGLVWVWIVIEIINGVGHSIFSDQTQKLRRKSSPFLSPYSIENHHSTFLKSASIKIHILGSRITFSSSSATFNQKALDLAFA